jgi:hypothetical protein
MSFEEANSMHPAAWRKSSFSVDGGECVELAWSAGQAFARDSKNPSGPQIPVDLLALIGAMKAGRFDR